MHKKTGFTLIELLAVIVILAIVALVTTPAILNVINTSRESGAQDKAWGTIEAVKVSYSQAYVGFQDTKGDATELVVTFSASGGEKIGDTNVTMSGERPTAGSVKIDLVNGEITASNLYFKANREYTCSTNGTGTKMCCEPGKKTNVTCS